MSTQTLVLSALDADEAGNAFTTALDEPFTYVIVLGTGPDSQLALDDISAKINSDHIYYASVRAIHAPEPSFIQGILKNLNINPDLPPVDWENLGYYIAFSITNRHKNIAGILTGDEIKDNTGGKINRIVRWAFAWDKSLDGNV